MKFLLRLLLLASATLTVARAQTVGILQPATGSSFVVNVGGSVTVSGGYAGFTPAAISVSAVGATTTTFNATFSGGIWTATWAPTALGSYTLRASSGTVTPEAAEEFSMAARKLWRRHVRPHRRHHCRVRADRFART